jgi:hypothetical protein
LRTAGFEVPFFAFRTPLERIESEVELHERVEAWCEQIIVLHDLRCANPSTAAPIEPYAD